MSTTFAVGLAQGKKSGKVSACIRYTSNETVSFDVYLIQADTLPDFSLELNQLQKEIHDKCPNNCPFRLSMIRILHFNFSARKSENPVKEMGKLLYISFWPQSRQMSRRKLYLSREGKNQVRCQLV